jgi:uncharacterized surface protein with fasciclin (FAS1) repeats
MKHTCTLYRALWMFFSISMLVSCNDNLKDYYKEPEWLKGSIYQVLQDRGDYTQFLKGIDLAGFKPMVNGKSILTVMAPTDASMTAYLNETYGAGTTIESLSKEELQKLIGFHIMYYAFDRNKLINFRPNEGDAATNAQKDLNAGLYYKHRTKSQDSTTVEIDTTGSLGVPSAYKQVHVYHLERFLPVFSYRMFNTKQIDAKYNYEYFYPNTLWADNAGFNVSNAAVDEYSVIADNGYLYLVDNVLKPLETIYKVISSNPQYSDFQKLYDKYGYYLKDDNLTLNYGNGTDLYQHYYTSPLPNIASEWPVTDYTKVADLTHTSYSVFAPSNSALNSFFNDYWKVGGYDSLQQVSQNSIQYLLFNSVYSSSVVFPEEITKGTLINSYGTVIKFDVDQVPVQNRKMCVNGSFYGCDVLTPPAMFGSVTGPAFQYKKFSYFLKMLTTSDLVLTLCSDATKYFVLYPTNDVMNADGITMVSDVLKRGTTTINGSAQQAYVYSHVVSLDGTTGSYTSLPTSGDHVLRTLSPGMVLYWYMHNGRVTNSVKFNDMLTTPGATEDDVFCNLEELGFRNGWTNGKSYAYTNSKKNFIFEGSLDNAIYGSFVPMMINNRNDATKLYYGFVQLLDKSGMLDIETQSINAMLESCLMFLPTTDALKQAIIEDKTVNKIPGLTTTNTSVTDANFFANCKVTNADSLQYYLKKYFIPQSTAVISNYPYVGWNETTTGGLMTLQAYDVISPDGKVTTITTKMNVTDDGSKLSVQSMTNEGVLTGSKVDVISTFHYFPFIFKDGCVHFINGIL